MEIPDSKLAKTFFAKTFLLKTLAILDDSFEEVFERDMRVYLVKSEEDFTRYALLKYQEDLKV